MKFLSSFSSVRSAQPSRRLLTALATCLLVVSVGCAETDEPAEETTDATVSPSLPSYDASTPSFPSFPSYDATVLTPPGADASAQLVDSSVAAPVDASVVKTDAAAAADGGFVFPDLGTLFPAADAGTAPAKDAGTSPGGRNVKGPCKDLNLLCFDFVDMWINAECATCNDGKGCQGCAIPYAY